MLRKPVPRSLFTTGHALPVPIRSASWIETTKVRRASRGGKSLSPSDRAIRRLFGIARCIHAGVSVLGSNRWKVQAKAKQ